MGFKIRGCFKVDVTFDYLAIEDKNINGEKRKILWIDFGNFITRAVFDDGIDVLDLNNIDKEKYIGVTFDIQPAIYKKSKFFSFIIKYWWLIENKATTPEWLIEKIITPEQQQRLDQMKEARELREKEIHQRNHDIYQKFLQNICEALKKAKVQYNNEYHDMPFYIEYCKKYFKDNSLQEECFSTVLGYDEQEVPKIKITINSNTIREAFKLLDKNYKPKW